MGRHTEAVDIYSLFKPVFFISEVLGLWPYSAVGGTGNRRITVTVSAVIYSLAMLILNAGTFAYSILQGMLSWENICSSGEHMLCIGTLCHAVAAYFTSLLGCRHIARQFLRLNYLTAETYYSVWRKDLQLLLAMQILCVTLIVTAVASEICYIINETHEFPPQLSFMLYFTADLAGVTSEHQFVAFIHLLKRTVQNCNNHIDAVCENGDVINDPRYRKEINRQEPDTFTVSNNAVTSYREKIHLKVLQFQQIRELHASACDIAESVNAIYSPMLLLSVAKLFTSLTQSLYYILVSFIVQKTSFFCQLASNESYFVWLIFYSVRLISLVHFTASTANEVSHKVQKTTLNCSAIKCPRNSQFVSVLKHCLPCFVAKITSLFHLQQPAAFHCQNKTFYIPQSVACLP
jgi:hypothetical protein